MINKSILFITLFILSAITYSQNLDKNIQKFFELEKSNKHSKTIKKGQELVRGDYGELDTLEKGLIYMSLSNLYYYGENNVSSSYFYIVKYLDYLKDNNVFYKKEYGQAKVIEMIKQNVDRGNRMVNDFPSFNLTKLDASDYLIDPPYNSKIHNRRNIDRISLSEIDNHLLSRANTYSWDWDDLANELDSVLNKSNNQYNNKYSGGIESVQKKKDITAFSNEKIVTITVTGTGETLEQSKYNALRSAIELAFGTFISTKTDILNDKLINDEIVSITNGNIHKFDVLSQIQMPNGRYTSSLKATVSITKLTSFAENKGYAVEFKGSLFGVNMRLIKMNEEAEYKAIQNLFYVSRELLKKSIDFELETDDPTIYNGSWANLEKDYYANKEELYELIFNVKCSVNSNYNIFKKYFINTLAGIAMPTDEIIEYQTLQKKIRYIQLGSTKYYLREIKSIKLLQNLFIISNDVLLNFEIIVNDNAYKIKKEKIVNTGYYDDAYRIYPNNRCNLERSNWYWDINYNEPGFSTQGPQNDLDGKSFPPVKIDGSVSTWNNHRGNTFYEYVRNIKRYDKSILELSFVNTDISLHDSGGFYYNIYIFDFPFTFYSHRFRKVYKLSDIERITKIEIKNTN